MATTTNTRTCNNNNHDNDDNDDDEDNNDDERPGATGNDQERCERIARVEQESLGATRSEESSNNVTLEMQRRCNSDVGRP